MRTLIISTISDYVNHHQEGKFDFLDSRGYEQPLFGFASANDSLFFQYKSIIDQRHWMPTEAFGMKYGEELEEGTVISAVLPLSKELVESNAVQKSEPSVKWTLARTYVDEVFKTKIGEFMVKVLEEMGYKAVVPGHMEEYSVFRKPKWGSSWSERHVAYAAGLGTFSINDALITEKGSAVRLISLVTDLVLEPDRRLTKTFTGNCLYCVEGKCGACMKRCPALAISEDGHDKAKCREYCYGEESRKLAAARGADANNGSGCGLCLTGVPCERMNPMAG